MRADILRFPVGYTAFEATQKRGGGRAIGIFQAEVNCAFLCAH